MRFQEWTINCLYQRICVTFARQKEITRIYVKRNGGYGNLTQLYNCMKKKISMAESYIRRQICFMILCR